MLSEGDVVRMQPFVLARKNARKHLKVNVENCYITWILVYHVLWVSPGFLD